MLYKEKIIKQLRKGYSPIGVGPKERINSIFNNAFKPLIDKKDLDFFFELFETNETRLRAWGILGIYHILKDKIIEEAEKKLRFHKIIIDLLNDKSEIEYFGGSIEIRTSLREHHVRRICELDKSLIFEPVYEYIQTSERKTDEVIGELLENVLTRVPDSRVEPLILHHAKNINHKNFGLKFHIINAFENLGQNSALKNKEAITNIFKAYLKDIEEDKTEFENQNERRKLEIANKKKKLQENVFKVAAVLSLDLEEETLEFLDSLAHPYKALHQIAEKYKNNERFKSILLKKLKESNNPHFIKDILIAILVLKENIQNWKDLIIENLNKFQIVDGDFIVEMQKVDLYSEDMLVNFLIKGDKWHLEFIREFLLNNPEKLNKWSKFRDEFIKILKSFKPANEGWDEYPNLKEKKELVLKLLIDLERKDMVEYGLDNFRNLEDSQLKKIALFVIIKFGKEELWLELKRFLKNNKESAELFKKFWRNLEIRDWEFSY